MGGREGMGTVTGMQNDKKDSLFSFKKNKVK